MPPLFVARPLEHQLDPINDPAYRKVWRWGRRSGKTTAMEFCAVMGHGPTQDDGAPLHRGMKNGLDVVWVFRDYPQSQIIWNTEIRPRFRGIDGVRMNENERTITIPAYGGQEGTLWVRSAEAIDGIKGIGKKLGGVMLDEAAQYADLEHAIKDVVLPALLDNNGWMIFGSTTVAGSYFNTICNEIRQGVRSSEWKEWHRTPFDNQRLSKVAIDELIAEYAQDSDDLKQQVYADLIEGGAGLAFPNWNAAVHTCKDFAPPQHWQWVAGMDWGITANSVVLLGATDKERRLLLSREWVWKDKDAYTAGYDLPTHWMHQDIQWPKTLWCDSAMDAETGIGGTTVMQEFQAGFFDACRGFQVPPVVILPAPKGPGSIVAGYNVIRKMLDWGPPLADGSLPLSRYPRLKIVKPDKDKPELAVGCPYLIKTLPIIKLDEKKQDQPESGGENHAVAALRYLLAGTWPKVTEPERDVPENVHPGYVYPGGPRRSRGRNQETIREEQRLVAAFKAQQSGKPIGGKYGVSARRG